MSQLAVNRRTGVIGLLLNAIMIAMLLSAWLVCSIAVMATLNSGGASPSNDAIFGGICGAIYLSRWSVMGMLFVLLPGSFAVRGVIVTLLFAAEAIVFAMINSGDPAPTLTLLFVPMILFSSGLPFEVARQVWNWRLDVDWADFVEKRQIGIRAMLIWITAAAMVLSLIRLADSEIALSYLGLGVVIALVNAGFVLPCTRFLMIGKRRLIKFFALLAGLMTLSIALVLVVEKYLAPAVPMEKAALPLAVVAFVIAHSWALLILRRLGVELKTGAN